MSRPRRVRALSRAILAMGAAIVLTLCGCNRPSNPDATIRRAYTWYVRTLKSGQDPMQRARTALRPLATDRFLTSMESVHSDFESGALIDPQAFDARLAVESVRTRGPAATARVVLTGRSTGRQALDVYLIKEQSAWKIDDVKLIDRGPSEF